MTAHTSVWTETKSAPPFPTWFKRHSHSNWDTKSDPEQEII